MLVDSSEPNITLYREEVSSTGISYSTDIQLTLKGNVFGKAKIQ